MAVLSFKNEQGRWEIVESPGALQYFPQELSDTEKIQARANIEVYSATEVNNKFMKMPTKYGTSSNQVIPVVDRSNLNTTYKSVSDFVLTTETTTSATANKIVKRNSNGDIVLRAVYSGDNITNYSSNAVSGREVHYYVDKRIGSITFDDYIPRPDLDDENMGPVIPVCFYDDANGTVTEDYWSMSSDANPTSIPLRDTDGDLALPEQSSTGIEDSSYDMLAVSGLAVKGYVDAQIAALETRLKAYIDETILNGEW